MDDLNQQNPGQKADEVVSALSKEFTVMGKNRAQSWHTYAFWGVALGAIVGVAFVANQRLQFDDSKAAIFNTSRTVPQELQDKLEAAGFGRAFMNTPAEAMQTLQLQAGQNVAIMENPNLAGPGLILSRPNKSVTEVNGLMIDMGDGTYIYIVGSRSDIPTSASTGAAEVVQLQAGQNVAIMENPNLAGPGLILSRPNKSVTEVNGLMIDMGDGTYIYIVGSRSDIPTSAADDERSMELKLPVGENRADFLNSGVEPSAPVAPELNNGTDEPLQRKGGGKINVN